MPAKPAKEERMFKRREVIAAFVFIAVIYIVYKSSFAYFIHALFKYYYFVLYCYE